MVCIMKKTVCFFMLSIPLSGLSMNQTLIDFTQPLEAYTVLSDATERTQGKSHGDLSYQAGIQTKKHYFFAFLNPQTNGAGFVSVHIPLKQTLQTSQSLCLTAEGLQDKPSVFQLVITTSFSQAQHFNYQHLFTVNAKRTDFSFSLQDFSATYRGKPVPDAPPLDTNDIQSIGIRIIGRDKTPNQAFQKGLYGLALYNLSVCNTEPK